MAKTGQWSNKVLAIIKTGNTQAAIAQIKVAPTVKDLNQLKAALLASGLLAKQKPIEIVIEESTALLSAPRLHRAP